MKTVKLMKLSPEQEALIPVVRDEWIEFALGGTGPIENPREHIDWIYGLSGLKPPRLLIEVESPMAMQLAQNALRRMGTKPGKPIVGNAVHDAVHGAVRNAVHGAVHGAVDDAVRNAVRSVGKWHYDYFSWIGACWSGWTAYFDYFHRIGIALPEIYTKWRALMRSGIWNCLLYENCAIVCRRPSKVRKDSKGRLHSLDKPAVEWADGFHLYFVSGVLMHNKILHPLDVCRCTEIEQPETITPERILRERNVEVRKALIQILGLGKFLQFTNAELMDEDTDASGMPRKLFRFDAGSGQQWCVVEVECPSKRDKHYLWVPPNSTRCSQAVAWTFGFEAPEQYRPLVEA